MQGGQSFHGRIEATLGEGGPSAVAVAFFDYQRDTGGGYQAERWFHAASTIKIPVLLGVFDAIERGELEPGSRVHVRNRFLSAAGGDPYRIDRGRDSDDEVHAAIGRTLQVQQLARAMIVRSSNLATNLLLDLVGIDAVRGTLERLGLRGIDLVRGVEDVAAWEQDSNNRVTAEGLLRALRVLHDGEHFSPDSTEAMLDILHGQTFRSGIPAGLPDDARVAHKTGEISTVAHDAGIVFLADREPWVVVILTEWEADRQGRRETIAALSRLVYQYVTDGERPDA